MSRSIRITGAGAGIDRATGRLPLAEGWDVRLLGHRREALEETPADPPARILTADVGNPDEVQAAFVQLPCLGVLLDNAGILPHLPIVEISVEPVLDVDHVARVVLHMAGLPLESIRPS